MTESEFDILFYFLIIFIIICCSAFILTVFQAKFDSDNDKLYLFFVYLKYFFYLLAIVLISLILFGFGIYLLQPMITDFISF